MEKYTAGQLIQNYRERKGFTQSELAGILGVSLTKLAHWEEGSTIPRPGMVDRLIGTLGLSADEIQMLETAVDEAKALRNLKEAQAQAEIKRLEHKRKAITLLWSGIAGFVAGVLYVFLISSDSSFEWYIPILIGLMVAGIPFGWSVLTDKSSQDDADPYYRDEPDFLIGFAIKLVLFLLKFIGAFLIGLIAYPIALLYHAYMAGRKGSLYRKIMCGLLILVCIAVGAFVVIAF